MVQALNCCHYASPLHFQFLSPVFIIPAVCITTAFAVIMFKFFLVIGIYDFSANVKHVMVSNMDHSRQIMLDWDQ